MLVTTNQISCSLYVALDRGCAEEVEPEDKVLVLKSGLRSKPQNYGFVSRPKERDREYRREKMISFLAGAELSLRGEAVDLQWDKEQEVAAERIRFRKSWHFHPGFWPWSTRQQDPGDTGTCWRDRMVPFMLFECTGKLQLELESVTSCTRQAATVSDGGRITGFGVLLGVSSWWRARVNQLEAPSIIQLVLRNPRNLRSRPWKVLLFGWEDGMAN